MRNRRKVRIGASILFIVMALLSFSGYILMFPEYFGFWELCEGTYTQQGVKECFAQFGLSIGKPLYFAAWYIAPAFFVLALLPQAHNSWRKFGLWALPLIIVLVVITPVTGETFSPVPSRGLVALRLAQGFLIISVLIMTYSWWKHSGQENANSDIES